MFEEYENTTVAGLIFYKTKNCTNHRCRYYIDITYIFSSWASSSKTFQHFELLYATYPLVNLTYIRQMGLFSGHGACNECRIIRTSNTIDGDTVDLVAAADLLPASWFLMPHGSHRDAELSPAFSVELIIRWRAISSRRLHRVTRCKITNIRSCCCQWPAFDRMFWMRSRT